MAKENTNLKIAEAPADRDGQQVTTPDLRPSARRRHLFLILTFLAFVALPIGTAGAYLFGFAADQYHSRAGFSVRSEEFSNPLDALTAFSGAGTASNAASDSQVLYDFIRSQTLAERLDAEFDFRRIFAGPPTGFALFPKDRVFGLAPDATAEDLTRYWRRMVTVSRDTATGIIDVEVRAFTPADAQALATATVEASAELVNELSQIAQSDAIRFAAEDVALAEARLADIRRQVREFRVENQIINPEADAASQTGVLAELQSMLAETLIRRGNIESFTGPDDPRLGDLDRQIEVIRNQIEAERAVFAEQDLGGPSLSEVIGTYEELLVDLEFSENAYTSSLAAAEQARAEARRQSRYAAVHIAPTLAEESLYPRRWLLLGIILIAAASIWAIMTLIYYNVRDRS